MTRSQKYRLWQAGSEHNRSFLGRTRLTPVVFHPLNLMTNLSTVNQLAALGLKKSLFKMRHQGLAFLFSPAFLGILGFKGATKHIFYVRIAATGKALVDQFFKIRR